MTVEEWLAFATQRVVLRAAREGEASWASTSSGTASTPKTPDGYYQVRGGIDYAIAKSLAAAPYADLLWMETKTADLHDAQEFADAIHAEFPDKMLAYNLSPSFNWDTTGMSDDEMRALPRGARRSSASSSTSSPTAATRSTAWRRGVRDRAARGRHARAGPPAAEVPPARVALPHAADAGRRAARRRRADGLSGRTADDQGHGHGLDPVPAPGPDRGAAEAARRSGSTVWAEHHGIEHDARASAAPAHARARSCSS